MFKFNEITIKADRGIIFLCGTKYRKNSMYDKRNVLKKYIESKYALKNILILEEHFVFGKRSGYLSYDDIFLKNLNDIETLTAAFADGIIIIHDSISTGAELAAFASNELLKRKLCVLEPDSTGIEERKISAFLELAFFGEESEIKRIVYYPEVYSYEISENHIEKRTNFMTNSISPILGRKICDFIEQCKINLNICFEEMKFKKANTNPGVISYTKIENELQVYVSGQVVLYQVIGLFSIKVIRAEIRKTKKLYEHVDYLCKQYKLILRNTVQKNMKVDVKGISIFIKEIDVDVRDVMAYSLYMMQALGLIDITIEKKLHKIVLKMSLDDFLSGIQEIISEETDELLELLNG